MTSRIATRQLDSSEAWNVDEPAIRSLISRSSWPYRKPSRFDGGKTLSAADPLTLRHPLTCDSLEQNCPFCSNAKPGGGKEKYNPRPEGPKGTLATVCLKAYAPSYSPLRSFGNRIPDLLRAHGFVTGPELAGAVSEAGGLGLMSFSRNPPELLRRDIAVMRAHTGLPFGVNMLLTADVSEQVAVCCEERVPILSFFWGDPAPFVKPAHDAGLKVMHQVGSVSEAEETVCAGVDVIIAQGVEAGGHVRGEVPKLLGFRCNPYKA